MSSLPTTLGKYQIIREIARSNDIVYEAYDPAMDRRVALKELNMPAGATDQQRKDRIERFERECRAGGRLAHPNIMTVYEFGEDAGRYFMAMEYLDGQTLRQEIDTRGALDPDRAVEIAIAVLRGLEHAHSNGVVHRDIKPDNIQLTSSGVKITDFGIARLTFQPNLTMDGQVFGTPSYMSPEQVRGGEIDARSDVFSVGVVLYEMLTGQKPFTGDSVITITYAILNHQAPMLTQVSYGLQRVVEQALEKSSALRYTSAQQMADALAKALADSKTGAFDHSPNPYLTPVPGTAIPQMGTPYGTVQPAAPPPTYNYNPYQQGPHQTGPVPQPGFPFPLPTYFPPPPRKPVLSPDQEALLKRVVLITLVLATFFGVVMVSILYFTNSLTPRTSGMPGIPMGSPEPVRATSTPVAVTMDPARAASLRAEGHDLIVRAERESSDVLWIEAGELLQTASSCEPDGRLARSDREEAAICFQLAYETLAARGETGTNVRRLIFRAAEVAPAGTAVAAWAQARRSEVH
jgi:serine/threonine-protein kinase